jgi:hypothetical protein
MGTSSFAGDSTSPTDRDRSWLDPSFDLFRMGSANDEVPMSPLSVVHVRQDFEVSRANASQSVNGAIRSTKLKMNRFDVRLEAWKFLN